MKKYVSHLGMLFFATLLTGVTAWGIRPVAPGQWRTHQAYKQGSRVISTPEKVYCVASTNLFSYDKQEGSIEMLSKVSGLSDVTITAIGYDPSTSTLVIGYENGNIDLLTDNEVYNLTDLKNKINLSNKQINNINCINGIAYLSCGFGIAELSVARREIRDSYLLGAGGSSLQIYDYEQTPDYAIAATENGLYMAQRSSNLYDYRSWLKISTIGNEAVKHITPFNQTVYAAAEVSGMVYLYRLNGTMWEQVQTIEGNITALGSGSNYLAIAQKNQVKLLNNVLAQRTIKASQIADFSFDNQTLWLANPISTLYRYDLLSGSVEDISPESPSFNNLWDVAAYNGEIWTINGAIEPNWSSRYLHGTVNYYNGSDWSVVQKINGFSDICNIALNPLKPSSVTVSAWTQGGIAEITRDIAEKVYTADSATSLTYQYVSWSPTPFPALWATTYDKKGNLWLTNPSRGITLNPKPISVKTPNGKWYALEYQKYFSNQPLLGTLVVTQNNHKWVFIPKTKLIFAFDENGTFDDASDDDHQLFQVVNTDYSIDDHRIMCMAEDNDGNMWIGTTNGPVVYNSAYNVFNTDRPFYPVRVKISRNDANNLADYLLQNEQINAIAVDGGNRKWFATAGAGVFLMSADATKTIHGFTAENSPLPSNNVLNVRIDQVTGEVFFITDKGMVSYRERATQGNEDFADVHVFPNPVREGFEGDIIVAGLTSNARVRITDISGNLVYETTSMGGQAVWNGRTHSGRKVSTGVYLVFCATEDGAKTHMTKLLFIK